MRSNTETTPCYNMVLRAVKTQKGQDMWQLKIKLLKLSRKSQFHYIVYINVWCYLLYYKLVIFYGVMQNPSFAEEFKSNFLLAADCDFFRK